MVMLRDFLYLNTNMLSNYLATIDGYLEQEFDVSETEKAKKAARLGFMPSREICPLKLQKRQKQKEHLLPPHNFKNFMKYWILKKR